LTVDCEWATDVTVGDTEILIGNDITHNYGAVRSLLQSDPTCYSGMDDSFRKWSGSSFNLVPYTSLVSDPAIETIISYANTVSERIW
jgi:hypothetical protein